MTESPSALPVRVRAGALPPGGVDEETVTDEETVVVVLSGRCAVEVDTGLSPYRWDGLGERADVFDGPASALYAPAGARRRIEASETAVRYAVISAPGGDSREPYVVRPGDVRTERRGDGVWAREVHDIIGPEQPADGLLVGETFSSEGVWSSYPPHKHDHHQPGRESLHQESFLIRVRPPSGFGVLIHYLGNDDRRQATVVEDGDIVDVTEGYHSFVAAAGHQFYYLWALAGTERVLHFNTDPRHRWLLAPEEGAS